MKIAHIINPVKVSQSSDLYVAQPVTFETMKAAKAFAQGEPEVELLSICYPEDNDTVPDYFTKLEDLSGSVLDIIQPERKKKFPLIKDILDRAYNYSGADYFVYSNVDIALLPQFYIVIKKIIKQGFDAFVINRRTITKNYTDIKDIPLMYSAMGAPHPGFDCFVFKREIYKKFCMGTACIGANWIGRVLITNLIANAKNFKIFDDLHLTFHIGDDRHWNHSDYYDYARHNEKELHKTLTHFQDENKVLHPMLDGFLKQVENINQKIPLYTEVAISQNPVFVVGFTRSGTTLLQSLVATQNNIYTFPETHFFCEYLNQYLKLDNEAVAKECLDEFFSKAREFSGLDIDWHEIEYLKVLAGKGGLTEKNLFENIVKHCLVKQLDEKIIPSVTWLEKTPYHGFVMDKILQLYPKARFVSIVRHPLPAIHSTKKYIHPKESYEFIAQKWKRMTSKIEEFKKAHPEKIYPVKYEDLVGDVGAAMKGICGFLNIDFEKDKLDSFSEVARNAVRPFEKWKKPILNKIISEKDNDDFLNAMPLQDIQIIQNLLKEERNNHGYAAYNKQY